jgi:fluoroacetyl-CoA thioesterase
LKPVPIGARGEAEETVEFEHTLTSHHLQLPPVYSTPDMIRLMETAAFHALQPYCEGDEISVGTAINIEHRAASGIGSKVKAEAIVEASMAGSTPCGFPQKTMCRRSDAEP